MERIKINKIYDAVKKVNRAYEIWAAKHGLTLYEMQIYYVIEIGRASCRERV